MAVGHQVEGSTGLTKLGAKIRAGGLLVLFDGSIGAMSATFVGHYPWFYTYNCLNATLPQYDRKKELPKYLARNAVIGALFPGEGGGRRGQVWAALWKALDLAHHLLGQEEAPPLRPTCGLHR